MTARRFLLALPAWLPAAAWYFLIWNFSAQTAAESSGTSGGLTHRVLTWVYPPYRDMTPEARSALIESLSFVVRKGAHMFLYFVLTGLLLLALRTLFRHNGRRAAATAALCALLAGLDEYHQTFVPGRSGELRDVLVDLSGGCVLLLLWWLLHRFLSHR